ncbi:MAG: HAD-IIB family hydrolase [Cyclobacteriaceae bacterium]
MQRVIFTDLDGTLLDFQNYSYTVAAPLVKQLQERDIPIVFCSSKTRAEQEFYQSALDNHSPFIVENGSAILIPKNYFSFGIADVLNQYPVDETVDFWQVVLGKTNSYIRSVIQQARAEVGINLSGYADLTLEEIKEITHLDDDFARRAATRDFSETLLKGNKSGDDFDRFKSILKDHGLLCVSGGKFHTVMGEKSDKGAAVKVLTHLFKQERGEIQTIGLGDSANDLPLLAAVDIPYLVQKPPGHWLEMHDDRIVRIDGIGPVGWVKALHSLGTV